MRQGTILGSQIGRWIIFAALVVALGALLLTIQPVGAQSSDGPPQLTIVPPNTVEHNENDDGAVYTFVATDPEGKTIFWTLSGTDADDFEIADGVLTFKNAPDYEIPLDATTENTPVAASDGTYEVTVRFSDGGNAAEHSMKVEVQDVEEDGMIMLSPLQPQVGTPLQAVIIDLDGVTTNTSFNPQATYVWSKSDSMSGTYTDIADATQETYTPTADDVGDYLRATVTYIEHASTRPAKTEVGTATLPVRADTHMNEAPVVPTEGQGQMRTGAADATAIIRYVAEDAAVGDKVGPPVTAVDDNRDMLTYSLGPAATGIADPTPVEIAAAAPFDIDAATGQITTNRVLDFDESLSSPADGTGVAFTPREVVVTATDPDGEVLSIRVDIRVTDVDEAPLFDPDLPREAIIMENSMGADLQVGTYEDPGFAIDPEDTAITRAIGGVDGGAFSFVGDILQFADSPDYEDPGDGDEDNPGDNLYELTVTATDATGMMSSLAVTVKVTNDPTDDDDNAPGTLEIFNRQPEVNTVLSVEDNNPMDPDGNVRSVKWQWYWQSATAASLGSPTTCPTTFDPADATAGDPDLNATSTWMKIDGATGSSYMPTLDRVDDYDTDVPQPDEREDADDAFDCLMVRASYLDDGPRVADEASTVDHDESRQYAYAISEFSVQNQDTDNVAPEFQDGDTALAGIQVRPRIQENFMAGPAIFNAVALATETDQDSTAGDFLTDPASGTPGTIRILDGTFTDADSDGTIDPFEGTYNDDDVVTTTNHKLTFSISGSVAFELVDKATGAINFMASPDYEVLAERRYTATLTAHDPTAATDSITIIVDAENVDEPPEFTGGDAAVMHDENTTDVETYTADDPESDRYFWGLTGTDAALFDIGVIDGRLTFRNAPNYEDPEDGDEGTFVIDGVYDVVVHLLLDGESLTDDAATPEARMMAVAITVVDVAEDPVFTKTTDDNDNVVPSELNIAENKQPDTMLNRAVENSPQASDEDEIPEDDMYASVALVYKISGTGTEALSIVPATGELRTKRVLDYESGDRSFAVKVTATDPTDRSDSIDLIINVTDEDEAPVGGGTNSAPVFASSAMTRSVVENTEAGIDIGEPITATDPQDQTIEYTLGGADAGHFDIDSATGQLMTSGALDHESKDTYTVTVTAKDDDATTPMSDETTVTITVTNVEEDGTVDLNTESPVVDGEVTATLSDLDGSISNVTWTWQTSSDDATWRTATGEATDAVTTSTYMPVGADTGRYLRATARYTDGYGVDSAMSESAMVVAAGDNVAPAFPSDTATRSIAENTAAGTNIGDPVAATDANGDTLTYTLEGTDAASFGIVSATGQLQTTAALDYETKRAYTVVVRATDPDGESDTIDVTINVTDVDGGTVTPVDPVDTYDTNGTAGIQIDEVFDAINAYFDDGLSIDDLFAVIDAYFG